MPLYDYAPTSGHCDKCHGRFEVYQRIAEAKLTRCSNCNQPVYERTAGTGGPETIVRKRGE